MTRGRAPAPQSDPLHPCQSCGTLTPISQLDGKPGPGHFTPEQLAHAGDTGQAFNRIECQACYGPGWNPL